MQPLFWLGTRHALMIECPFSLPFVECMQLFLGYSPVKKDAWEVELAKSRLRYADLKSELLVNPASTTRETISRKFVVPFNMEFLLQSELLLSCESDNRDILFNIILIYLNVLCSQSAFSRNDDSFSFTDQDRERDLDGPLCRHDISNGDHPLSHGSAFFLTCGINISRWSLKHCAIHDFGN